MPILAWVNNTADPFTGTLIISPVLSVTTSANITIQINILSVEIVSDTYFDADLQLQFISPETTLIATASQDDIVIFATEFADIYYLFTLTGKTDNTTDVEIPISSFQARKQNGSATYLQVTIPGVESAGQIAARSNGTLKIDMAYKQGGEFLQRKNIIQAELTSIRLDEGTKSKTITLIGYKTESFTKKSMTLTGSTYRSVIDGKVRHRIVKPNIYLNPGDTVTIGDDVFDANVLSYYFMAIKKGINQNMEISES